MELMETVLVKLGGSLITDKSRSFTVRREVVERLASEINAARRSRESRLILGHGGGSYPHQPAMEYETHKGLIRPDSRYGFAMVQDAAARLNRIVVAALLEQGVSAVAVSPSSACIAEHDRITEFYTRPLQRMLEAGMLPVVYGDVGIDLAKGCCILSTEEILYSLAADLGGRRVIMAGKTGGVYTADPNLDPDARHIERINRQNFESVKRHLTDSDGIDVTGGMLLKVGRAIEAAERGIETQIINGAEPGQLKRALLGDRDIGTLIVPA